MDYNISTIVDLHDKGKPRWRIYLIPRAALFTESVMFIETWESRCPYRVGDVVRIEIIKLGA